MALTGWQYYKIITLTNPDSVNYTNFNIKIELTSSNFDFTHAKSDGSDIRFTDDNKSTLLDYYIKSWDSAGETAEIYVKIPSISASSAKDIYMYYGNSSASSLSSGEDTFSNASFSNVVAYYPLDSNANDLSGNYNGIVYGGLSYTNGKFNDCGNFDGVDDYIDTTYIHSSGSQAAVSLWVNFNDITKSRQCIFGDIDTGGTNKSIRLHIAINNSAGYWDFQIGDGSSYWINDSVAHNLSDNTWYHIVLVINGTSIKLYNNANLVANLTSSISLSDGSNKCSIGRLGEINGWYTDALIDQVRVFNYALTEDRVQILYNEVYIPSSPSLGDCYYADLKSSISQFLSIEYRNYRGIFFRAI